jgi:hypothetical protein
MQDNEYDVYPTNGVEINKMTFTHHPVFLLNQVIKENHNIKSDLDYVLSLTDLNKRHDLLMNPSMLLPQAIVTNDMVLNYSVKKGFGDELESLMSRFPEFEMEERNDSSGQKQKQSYKNKFTPSMSNIKKKKNEENKIKITPFPKSPLM